MAEEIIIAGWIDWEDPAHRDEALKHLGEMSRRSREEPGCLDYSMTADPGDPCRIRVFEHWASPEALGEHLASGHMADFSAATAELSRTGRSLTRFVVSDGAPFSRS